MKNVLLTTTALVAFAGSAFAASHQGVSFSGSAELKYNDLDGFSYGADLDVTGMTDLGNGITVSLTYGIALDSNASPTTTNATLTGDPFPTLTIESMYGTLSYGESPEMANDHFSDTDGMDLGFNDKDDFEDELGPWDVATLRFDSSYSGVDFSVSGVDMTSVPFTGSDFEYLQLGVSGAIGSINFGAAYEEFGGSFGINVGTTLGAFSVDVAYFDSGTFFSNPTISGGTGPGGHGSSYGIALGYDINSMISVGAYFAQNDYTAGGSTQNYGVSLTYANGPLTVDVAYDDDNGTGNASIDVEYELSGTSAGLTAYAGYDQADGGYVGIVYDLTNGAEIWASYSDFDESGAPEFDDGITVGVSYTF